MAGIGKRAMPENAPSQSAKKRKVCILTKKRTKPLSQILSWPVTNFNAQGGGAKWQKQQSGRNLIESGDWGVLITCDMGRENKCIGEAVDVFSQVSQDRISLWVFISV